MQRNARLLLGRVVPATLRKRYLDAALYGQGESVVERANRWLFMETRGHRLPNCLHGPSRNSSASSPAPSNDPWHNNWPNSKPGQSAQPNTPTVAARARRARTWLQSEFTTNGPTGSEGCGMGLHKASIVFHTHTSINRPSESKPQNAVTSVRKGSQ